MPGALCRTALHQLADDGIDRRLIRLQAELVQEIAIQIGRRQAIHLQHAEGALACGCTQFKFGGLLLQHEV